MRVKSDDRRKAILGVATDLFRRQGYERTSMAEISAQVGGSKATLYNYFKSKEELFAAAMMEAMEERGEEVIATLDASIGDVRAVLLRFCAAYLDLVTAEEALAITRAAVAEGAHTKVGPLLYERGPRRGWRELSAYMDKMQALGMLRPSPPGVAAAHLLGMLEAGVVEPLLFGAKSEFSRTQAVRTAVDAFLQAYAQA